LFKSARNIIQKNIDRYLIQAEARPVPEFDIRKGTGLA